MLVFYNYSIKIALHVQMLYLNFTNLDTLFLGIKALHVQMLYLNFGVIEPMLNLVWALHVQMLYLNSATCQSLTCPLSSTCTNVVFKYQNK